MSISVEMLAVLTALLTTSTATAAVFLGLWLGERGRRMDAQRREGVIRVDAPEPAEVIPPGGGHGEGTLRELAEAPDKWILETMAETGCSEEEAQEEWSRLVGRSFGEQGSGWTNELP